MEGYRRQFLKWTGVAGFWPAFARNIHGASAQEAPGARGQRFNMSGYAAPKLERVRLAIIGMGNRGTDHMQTMRHIEGAEIVALCDLLPERVVKAKKHLEGSRHNPDLYSGSPEEWKRLCERTDVDLVMITTPYYMHANMAVYAMEHEKHAASEVPAAATMAECWKLVETAERTRKHCIMLENYAYGFFQLVTLNMARRGFFGEIVHGDCAYNTSKIGNNFSKTQYWDMWWLRLYAAKRGNVYPTHGLGPVCQIMDINRGDRLDYLVSMESNDFTMAATARLLAAKDDFYRPFAEKTYRGNINTTLIRTVKGRTIMVQHDPSSPRGPHSVIHAITGTKAMAQEYPLPARISKDLSGWLPQEEFDSLAKEYTPAIVTRVGEYSKRIGSAHGGGDLLQDWRLIDCLCNGLPLDQDVYDAAAWSSIVPLSEQSVLSRSASVEIPDFTKGAWQHNRRNMDINLMRGGTTRVLG